MPNFSFTNILSLECDSYRTVLINEIFMFSLGVVLVIIKWLFMRITMWFHNMLNAVEPQQDEFTLLIISMTNVRTFW